MSDSQEEYRDTPAGPLAAWVSCPGCPGEVQDVTVTVLDGEHIGFACENCGSSVEAYHCDRKYLEDLI
jgi:hypothetical protein